MQLCVCVCVKYVWLARVGSVMLYMSRVCVTLCVYMHCCSSVLKVSSNSNVKLTGSMFGSIMDSMIEEHNVPEQVEWLLHRNPSAGERSADSFDSRSANRSELLASVKLKLHTTQMRIGFAISILSYPLGWAWRFAHWHELQCTHLFDLLNNINTSVFD